MYMYVCKEKSSVTHKLTQNEKSYLCDFFAA